MMQFDHWLWNCSRVFSSRVIVDGMLIVTIAFCSNDKRGARVHENCNLLMSDAARIEEIQSLDISSN